MIVRQITQSGDWTYGAGRNNYLSANAAVAQTIACRLMSFLGDCFFATDAGIDWWNLLGGKNELALQLAINAVILNTENVTGIVTLNVALDHETRAFSISYTASTSFGNVSAVVNQTLGVGPVGPPAVPALLPQFNQTLDNNASATTIIGAMFNSVAFWGIDLNYYIERRTSTQNFVQRGVVICEFNIDTGLWSLTDNVLSGSSGPTSGVTFTIDASTGQVSYASDNITGSSYVGNLIIGSGATFVAGV